MIISLPMKLCLILCVYGFLSMLSSYSALPTLVEWQELHLACVKARGALWEPASYLLIDVVWVVIMEDKREDYQNCSVLYCVQQLYSRDYTHMSSSYRCTRDCWFRFSLGYFVSFVCIFLPRASLWFLFVLLVYFLIFIFSCQYQCKWFSERLVSKMTYYILSRM